MKITVRVFGRYKNITGKEKIQLDMTKGNTIRDLIDVFVMVYPITIKDKDRIMVTKNKMYTSYETTITEEDEITLTPPVVSGG